MAWYDEHKYPGSTYGRTEPFDSFGNLRPGIDMAGAFSNEAKTRGVDPFGNLMPGRTYEEALALKPNPTTAPIIKPKNITFFGAVSSVLDWLFEDQMTKKPIVLGKYREW